MATSPLVDFTLTTDANGFETNDELDNQHINGLETDEQDNQHTNGFETDD